VFRKSFWAFVAVGLCLFYATPKVFAKDELVSDPLSHYIMAIVYDDLGDVDSAIKEYKRALKAGSQSSLVHLNLAASLIKNNELDKARAELDLAVKLDPEAAEPHAVSAILYLIQEKNDLATQEYEIALKNASRINPQDTEIYKSLGALYLKQGKLKEAEDIYSLIVSLAPRDPAAHFYLGTVLCGLGKDHLCEKEVKRALELDPDYCQALNFLGYEYVLKNQNLREAERLLNRAVRLEPDNGAYLDSLGWLYFKLGRTKKAKLTLEKALLLMKDPVIYEHLGDVNYKLKDFTQAKMYWQKSLELDANQDSIKKKIDNLNKNVGSTK